VGLTRHRRSPAAGELRPVGELIPLVAVDRSGLAVTSQGTFVHVVHVSPPNPLILSPEDREAAAASFCYLAGRLRAGQCVQFYVQARPVNLEEVLASSRREVTRAAGPAPSPATPAADRRARDRWRLYAAMEESLRMHADDQAAVQFDAYMVVPFTPDVRTARRALADLTPRRGKPPQATLERDLQAHGRAVRQALAHTDALRSELDAMDVANRVLDGEELLQLLWSRFNPTLADAQSAPASARLVADLNRPRDAALATAEAAALRDFLGASAIDFSSQPGYAIVDHDLEQTIYTASTADATYFGWLMTTMMSCRQPYTISVFVHALDRKRERDRLKRSYRRVFAVNRSAEAGGRVPDFDRYFAEGEHQQLLQEMSGHERVGIFRVSIYQSIRVPGPGADPAILQESVDEAAEHLGSASDCRVDYGRFQQAQLWPSTLPLGHDAAHRTRKYATRNVGDSTPLLGVSMGSPSGIPFAFTEPGRTLERFNPYDRAHANHLCLVTGRSGAGKTMLCNVLLSRMIAHGARGFVIDRAGHYRVLTQLIDGAQHIDIGADDSRFHLNPWDVDDPANVSREKVAFLIGLHQTLLDEGLGTLERSQLGAAIRAVYERCAAEGLTPREGLLRDELLSRADGEAAKGAAEIAFTLRTLAEQLGEFCDNGAYAHIADQESSHVPDSPLLVFDTKRCPDAVLKPVILTVLEHITRTVEHHRDRHRDVAAEAGAPTFAGRSVLLGDEFWAVVSNPALGGYANDLARRSRHLGLTLLISTQQLSDLDNEHGLALLRNSTMQIFLSQHQEELGFVQRALGLTGAEIALIARLKTVKGGYSQAFWVNGTRGRGQVSLRVGPTEMWAFTSDPVRDAPQREQKIAEHDGDMWRAIADLAGHPVSAARGAE
jgi:energy-coupling factor transporter ATP-binding protein EcfA2